MMDLSRPRQPEMARVDVARLVREVVELAGKSGRGVRAGSGSVPDPELVERPKRRRFSAKYKLEILEQAEACTRPGEIGELVITRPMPSMPVFFWGDADGSRYREAYFETYPGVWRHGDWIRITPTGGAVIYGRSDSTINRGGVRMGTSEIYRAALAVPQVTDALVVDVPAREGTGDSWMPLFVVLADGEELSEQVTAEVKTSALRGRGVGPDHGVVPDGGARQVVGRAPDAVDAAADYGVYLDVARRWPVLDRARHGVTMTAEMTDLFPDREAGVQALVDRLVVAKEQERWLLVGRACRVLDQFGASPTPIGSPPIAPNMAYAPAVAWAATGLNRPGWGEDALGRSAARLLSGRQELDVTDRACVLSASGRGCAPELREGETDWNIGRAPFWLLRSLYADRSEDPYLEPVLSECESQVLARASRDTSRADWNASRLRLMLGTRKFLQSQSEDHGA